MSIRFQISTVLAGLFLSGIASATEEIAFFESKVRPLLVAHCYECHSEEAGERKGGLWLDRRLGWAEGGDAGPALVPGDVEGSLLVHSVRYSDPELQMPPKTRLSNEEVAVLEQWVAGGAHDPRDESMAAVQEAIDFEAARRGWAYRPFAKVDVPAVKDAAWPRNEIDRFLLAGLETKGLEPAPDADPGTLLRRLHYDLTGLPPTRDELTAFVADPSPDAFAESVDDLLSRPAFGEKWGRHWLDVARYADSNGGDRNFTFYQAWRYRNWVIDAFNRDLSYYDFVRAQLAGDLLPSENNEEEAGNLIASTFLALGPKMLTERDKEKLWLDTADEQLDTAGRAFLGLTLGCARCHDHKFDPVSQEDYYALAGIFRSTEVVTGTRNGCVNVASWIERPLPLEGPEGERVKEKVERLELAMRLTVEMSYKKKASGEDSTGDLPLAGVIYDDGEAQFYGDWKKSSHSSSRVGDGYLHDDQKGKGENRAVFRGSLPESGLYEIRVSYSPGANRAERIPVSVVSREGTSEVILDQTRPPQIAGLFEPIGRFDFEKGGDCQVVFETAGTEGRYVIIDAVQFIPVADIEREAAALAAVAKDTELDPIYRMSEGELKKELNRLIEALKEEEVAMAPRDAADADDCHLRVRGEVGILGGKIPRSFLTVLYDGPPPAIAPGQSGRLELAEWITDESNALLDRVAVNRAWHYLFGRGIVETVDNFGTLGSGPTHPELLDFLARNFRESGGSFKHLVRELVLSRAYGLSALATDSLAKEDPANEWFGHQNYRRLTAEEIRDSILFLSGELDPVPGTATATPLGVDLDKPYSFREERKRTVYLPVARNNLATELAVFDGANPDLVSGARSRTTVPTQALYLLNSDFLHEQAVLIGKQAMEASALPGEEIKWLYQTLLGRAPNPVEFDRSLALLADLSGGAEDREAIAMAAGHLAHLLIASTEFLFLN